MKEVECKRVCEGEWHSWRLLAVQVKLPPLNAFLMVYNPVFARSTSADCLRIFQYFLFSCCAFDVMNPLLMHYSHPLPLMSERGQARQQDPDWQQV